MIQFIDQWGLRHHIISCTLTKMYSIYDVNKLAGYQFNYVEEGRAIGHECFFETGTWSNRYQIAIVINDKIFHYDEIDKDFGNIKVMLEQDLLASMIDKNLP